MTDALVEKKRSSRFIVPVNRTIRLTSIFLLVVGIVDLGASFQDFQASDFPNLWLLAVMTGLAALVLAIMAFLAVFLVWVGRGTTWIVPLAVIPAGASALEALGVLTIQGVPMLYDFILLFWIAVSAIPIIGTVLWIRSAALYYKGSKPPICEQ